MISDSTNDSQYLIQPPNIQRQLNQPITKTPAQQMALWIQNPKIFLLDCFDFKADLWQEDVLDLYMGNDRTGMIASKGPGKTGILAGIVWHFFLTKLNPKIACLSVTEANLKANLWAELLMMRFRSKLAQKSTKEGGDKISMIGKEGFVFIEARSYPKSADANTQASALAGLHADNIMFAVDEAGTIPDAVLATADAALSTGSEGQTKCAKLVVAANPEVPSGMLYKASKGKTVQKWAIYHISGDPDDPRRAPRVSIEWAKEQIATYGRDNPWVMINVLAQYPNVAVSALLTDEEVDAASQRTIEDKDVRNSQYRVGVDVARDGVDNTSIAPRRGLKAYPIEELPSTMYGPEIAGKLMFKAQEEKIERIFVDNTGGYGSSVIDSLGMSDHLLDVTGIKYNAKAQDKRYYNKRTEMWVRMRDWIRKGGCIPNDGKLKEELTMPKIFWHGGVMRLEEKDQIKVRLKRSPDRADALAQTFADVESASFYHTNSPQGGALPGHAHQYPGNQRSNHISDSSQVDENHQPSSNHKS